jgi:hypothetical protein
MPKSNKELAVELYAAIIQAAATVAATTTAQVAIPTSEKAVEEVAKLAKLLSEIKD